MYNNKSNIFDEERRDNFYELYISNVDKRLRELDQPKDVDCKRWVWELIQNAKDSIVGQNDDRNHVDIEIIVEGDNYTFKHNGSPFIKKTLYGLLYKYSKGKRDNSETTGRFGTGFLTTHTLSKTVNISGDIILNDEIKGFKITMFREGEGDELLDGLNKTEDSFQIFDQSFGWTSFEYLAKTERNKEAGKLGIQNFKENITKVMLFCPEIHSIKLIDNGKNLVIERGDNISDLYGGCEKLTLIFKDEDYQFKRKFLYVKVDESNDFFNKRFKNNRNLKICCAIELDDENNIFVDESSPCLFCSLPFVGSEKHKLPYIINSPNFEPDSERQSILLDGAEFNELTGKISDQGINKMILIRSQQMYENILECLCKENIGKRYYLARGLTSIPENDEIQSFDHQWYKEKFITPMRNILIKYPIVWNGDKYIELKTLPIIKYYKSLEIQQQAYNFIAKVYDYQIPTFEETIEFEYYIWKNDSRINYITMKECAQYVSNLNNMNTLGNKIENPWKWMDDFLIFIKNYEFECLRLYNIIPNMNSEFVRLTDNIATSKEVPDNMIECLEMIGQPWKLTHIHKNIKKYSSGMDHNIQYAVSVIRNSINKWSNTILTLISFIPNDNEDKIFVQKRQIIYELCSKIFINNMPHMMDGNSFPKELWNGIDEIVFDKLIKYVMDCGKLGGNLTIDYMKKFLECVSEYYPVFRNYPIVPNQNGNFCQIDTLYEDHQIPDLFKQCMKDCFKFDIKEELIEKQLESIKSLTNGRNKKIHDYNDLLNKYFQSSNISVESKKIAAKLLIRIIPEETENEEYDWQIFQRKYYNIYKLFTRDNDECFKIENNYNNNGLWHYTNKYICKEIISIIEKYNDINELATSLNISELDKIYEYLNIINNILSEGKIIPNQYNVFCYLDNLYNEGISNIETKKVELISEELKDIAKDLGYDVRKYLIHPKMERVCKSNVSEKEINEKIAKLMEENNDNPITRSDTNFTNVANSLIEYNFKKIRNNSLDDEIMYIFGKVYIANIRNRLRELDNPCIEDCKRWVWELIQNAKDSIVGQKDRKYIDIEISVEGNKYIFKHNGSPFTNKTLPALLYKFSEGKANSIESTGRFGTGFLTTHSLSKTIKISGEIITRDQTVNGFTVTMYREGEEDELLDGLNKTKNSYSEFPIEPESRRWTSYEYITKTERNKEAGKLGIQNFKENITKVMLFCPEIRSIKLNDNGKILSIDREENNKNLDDGCKKLTLNIRDDDKHFSRSFIYEKIEESNNKLSERFATNRNIRICCAIELDENNNIFVDESTPCLYCSLPLVGSEKHKLPFILNSQDFELDTERQSILLDGDEVNGVTGKITNQGINKMILRRSQQMYENILKCLCKENIKKRFYLARGLTSVPKNDEVKFFDHQWYKNNFVIPVRNILIKYPIVWNGDKYIELKTLPIIKYYKNLEIQQQAYNFIAKVYDNQVPVFEETIKFEKYIWKNDSRINYITMKECAQYVSNLNNMNTLGNKIENPWKWMDDFLVFIKNYEFECLRLYNIIPNMNSEFVRLTDNIATSKEVPDNMIECLEMIGQPWKLTHIHKNIKKYSPGMDHNIQYAVSVIRNIANKWSNKTLIVISYIPNDNEDKKYLQKRQTIYELCSNIFNSIPNKMDGSSFPKEIWNGIDEVIFERLIENIKGYGTLGGKFSIDYMKKFLECVSEYYPVYRNYPVVPNQNGKFCLVDSLYEDMEIPDLFKQCMKDCFNYDIKNELINNQLTSIKSLTNGRKKRIQDYCYNLKTYFKSKSESNVYVNSRGVPVNSRRILINSRSSSTDSICISESQKKKASKYLIRIIPKKSENKDFDWRDNQRKLFDIYKIFTKTNDYFCEINRDECNTDIWNIANTYIYNEIKEVIEKYDDIQSLATALNLKTENIFEYLNSFVKFSKEGKIIPNQNGEFCYLNQLYNEDTSNNLITNELKDIAKDLGNDIRKSLIHPLMEKQSIPMKTYEDICNIIDLNMEKKYNNSLNHSKPKFKRVVNNLVESYYDEIGDENFKKYFKYTSSERENIILKIIYNKEARKNMAELGKKYGEECIPKLLQNENMVNFILEGKLSDNSNLKLLIDQYEDYNEIIGNLLDNPKIIALLKNGEIINNNDISTNIKIKPTKYKEMENKYGQDGIQKLLENEDIVDMIIKEKLRDSSNIKTFIEQYNDEIFEIFLENPEIISMIYNRNLSDETYKSMNDKSSKCQTLEENYGKECIPKLIENKNIVNMIINGSNIKTFIEQYSDEIFEIFLENPEIISMINNRNLSDETYKSMNDKSSKCQTLEENYGKECIPKLIENKDIVNMIINGSNIKTFIEQYSDEIFEIFLENPEIISMINNRNLSDETYKSMNDKSSKCQTLEENYGKECIPKLIENKNIVNMIIDGKIKDNSSITQVINQFNDETLNKILENPILIEKIGQGQLTDKDFNVIESSNNKKISLAFNSDLVPKEKEFYTNTIKEVMEYYDDFDYTTSTNKIIGYMGEAHIYEFLCRSNKFKSVTWLRIKENGQKWECNGKEYYIDQNESPNAHHIVIETFDDHKIYIEVKSTRYGFGKRVPIYLGSKQNENIKNIRSPDKYILAVVYGVMNNPKFFFIDLKNNILPNINKNDINNYNLLIDLENQYGKDRIFKLFSNRDIINMIIYKQYSNDYLLNSTKKRRIL